MSHDQFGGRMITCQTYTFREDGKHTLNLTLPCFSGSAPDKNDEDFYAAARMNRFYGKTAEKLYEYARSFMDPNLKRLTFICRTDTDFADDGTIVVTLELTLRRLHENFGCPTLRRRLVHRWRDGVLTEKPYAADL